MVWFGLVWGRVDGVMCLGWCGGSAVLCVVGEVGLPGGKVGSVGEASGRSGRIGWLGIVSCPSELTWWQEAAKGKGRRRCVSGW